MSATSRNKSKSNIRARLREYPKLTKSKARLLPYRNEIKALRDRNAAFSDIQLILAQEEVVVSLSSIFRFCRDVLGEQSAIPSREPSPKNSSAAIDPTSAVRPALAPPQSLQATLRERREHLPGVWGRRKRGPRIADSKNL